MISGRVNAEDIQVPALAFRQRITPLPSAEVFARFSDGSAAAVSNRYGRGQAILWGTLLGLTYVQTGLPNPLPPPDRGPFTHTPLNSFHPDVRRLLIGPSLPYARRGAVSSEPLVETGLLETERAVLVPLVSLMDGPRQIELLLHDVGQARAVRSVRRGALPFTQEGPNGAHVRTSLTLDPTDFVIVER